MCGVRVVRARENCTRMLWISQQLCVMRPDFSCEHIFQFDLACVARTLRYGWFCITFLRFIENAFPSANIYRTESCMHDGRWSLIQYQLTPWHTMIIIIIDIIHGISRTYSFAANEKWWKVTETTPRLFEHFINKLDDKYTHTIQLDEWYTALSMPINFKLLTVICGFCSCLALQTKRKPNNNLTNFRVVSESWRSHADMKRACEKRLRELEIGDQTWIDNAMLLAVAAASFFVVLLFFRIESL